MSDFMPWLYTHYIKPQIDAAPRGDYSYPMDALGNILRPSERGQLDKTLEFTAIQDGSDLDDLAVSHGFHFGLPVEQVQQAALVVGKPQKNPP